MSLRQATEAFSNTVITRRVASRFAAESKEQNTKFFVAAATRAEKALKAIARYAKQLRNAEDAAAPGIYSKLVVEGHHLIDEAVTVHKKLQPLKGPHADAEFKVMGASIHKLERIIADGEGSTVPSHTASQIKEAAELLYGDIHRVSALAVSKNL